MEYNLRSAAPEDLQVILDWVTSPEQLRLWGGPALTYPPRVDRTWGEIGATTQNTFSLIDAASHVSGLGQILLREKDTAHLARIIVSPALRRNGIGHILCQQLMRVASQRYGTTGFTLNVYKDNLPAVKLYRSLGFIIVAEDTEQNWFRMQLRVHPLPAL